MSNQVFGNRYQVTEKIGMGGMAEVFKATDATLGRTVAVKVMLPQYAADSNFAARFRQEAQAAANLNSPYIVNIYDWGRDQDSYYIVMELVRGTDLKTAIQQRGHIHPRKVAEIGSQVCSALSVAHGYDIIHRDIKSANIMVQADGNVKVMDFGIAQAGVPGMTQDSSVLGTAHYVSPEQAQGKHLTPASDLYSLGIVLYEAATGKLPFDGPDVVSVAMKQVSEAPVPPRKINPEIDPAFEQIILRAMEKDPVKRFSTANEMKRAIDDYLKGSPSMTSAATQVIGGNAKTGGYQAGKTTVMPQGQQAQTQQVRPQESIYNPVPKKRSKKPIVAVILVLAVLAIGVGVAFGMGLFGKGQITVPDVTDKTRTEATQVLEDAGFAVGVSYDTSDEIEKDRVISQDPRAETQATAGSTVNIVVSTGKPTAAMVAVPNLIGYTASEAEQALSSVGLVGKSKTANSDSYDAGQVFDQDPTANSQVAAGSTVTYTISMGKKTENKTVPSVIGLTEDDATSTLEALGFKVSVKEGSSQKTGVGEVYDQSPSKGTESPEGATVTIYVNTTDPTGGTDTGDDSDSGSSSGSDSGSGSGGSSGSGSDSGSGSGGSSGSGSDSGSGSGGSSSSDSSSSSSDSSSSGSNSNSSGSGSSSSSN